MATPGSIELEDLRQSFVSNVSLGFDGSRKPYGGMVRHGNQRLIRLRSNLQDRRVLGVDGIGVDDSRSAQQSERWSEHGLEHHRGVGLSSSLF